MVETLGKIVKVLNRRQHDYKFICVNNKHVGQTGMSAVLYKMCHTVLAACWNASKIFYFRIYTFI